MYASEVSWAIGEFEGGAPYEGQIGDCGDVIDVPGCMDESACNYNADSTIMDESMCDYSCVGCFDMLACNAGLCFDADGNAIECTISDETLCDFSCYGCTDTSACNYDADATETCGDCCTYDDCSGCMDPTSCDYNPNATVDDGTCICSGAIDLYLETDYYSNEVSWELLDDTDIVIDSGSDYFQGGQIISSSYCLSIVENIFLHSSIASKVEIRS